MPPQIPGNPQGRAVRHGSSNRATKPRADPLVGNWGLPSAGYNPGPKKSPQEIISQIFEIKRSILGF